jgi:hypothetical protein
MLTTRRGYAEGYTERKAIGIASPRTEVVPTAKQSYTEEHLC